MSNLQIVDERKILDKEFKIYGDFENPLFLAKDVADWIDYAFKDRKKGTRNVNMMLQSVDEDEKLVARLMASGQNREMWFLTEDGVYEILMLSRKPIAKEFKREIKKILKTIRKTGGVVANTEMFVNEYFANLDEATKQFLTITLDDKKKLLEENEKLNEEVLHKQDVIVGLVEDVDLATKRQRLQQIMKYGFISGKQMSDKWKLLYSEFESIATHSRDFSHELVAKHMSL